MNLKLFAPVLAVGLLTVSEARAHHPFAATYVEDKTMQVEGKLVEFQFKNPHSLIQLEAKDEKGQVVHWSIEWAGADQLGSEGVRNKTLKYGDVVTITGNPGRLSEDHRIRLISLRRNSDNFRWIGQR